MILYSPLDIPKIVPNDWDEWWKIWEKRDYLTKVKDNHNYEDTQNENWKGIDLYIKPFHQPIYSAPLAPMVPVVRDLTRQVFDIFGPGVSAIRVIENNQHINFHADLTVTSLQIRSVLWSTYKNPLWRLKFGDEIKPIMLPEDTNSFCFQDYPLEHEAIYEPGETKGLLVIYSSNNFNNQQVENILNRSIEKYKDCLWKTPVTLLN